jgi:hypothetical protein
MNSGPMARTVLAVALTFALGCPRKAPPPVAASPDAAPTGGEIVLIEDVAVEVAAWLPEAGPAPEAAAVASRVWETLTQSQDFEARGRGPSVDAGVAAPRRGARLKAEVGIERAEGRLRAGAGLALTWTGADEEVAPWAAAACDGDEPGGPQLAAAATTLLECALDRAARSLVDKQAIRRGDAVAVLRALESDDPALRQVAFAVIAERGMRGAVPRLLELLASRDELVRDGAIGALVALREQRAVPRLIDLAEFRDLDMMRRIIDAVGAIGGEEAAAYLDVVASGHDVQAVRELAAEALERLRRRVPDGGKP